MSELRKIIGAADWRTNVKALARTHCATPAGMTAIVELMNDSDVALAKRAAWVFHHGGEFHRHLVPPLVGDLLPQLDANRHPSFRRNIIRALQFVVIPEEYLGEIVTRCFNYLLDPKEGVACRAFSTEILWQACLREPDLMPELAETLELVGPTGKPGLRFRARQILGRIGERKVP